MPGDNGPQYVSQDFAEFEEAYDFRHISSSPYDPQSNGQVEHTMKTVKQRPKDAKDPHMALLTYLSTTFPW